MEGIKNVCVVMQTQMETSRILAPLQGFTTDIMLVFYGGQYLDLGNLKY